MASSEDEDDMPLNEALLNEKRYTTDSISLFGVDLTADNIAVAMVYFVQGVLGLSRLAVNFYLKDDLHLDPAEELLLGGGYNTLKTAHEIIANLASRLARWDDRIFRKSIFGAADEVELKFVNRLMLHHSSSGTCITMVLKSAARRRLLPRRKESRVRLLPQKR